VNEIDGFAYYSNATSGYADTIDTATIMQTLGIPHVNFSAAVTMGGGGSAGAIGLASSAILTGNARYVVTVMGLQQRRQRLGSFFAAIPPTAESSFLQPAGLSGPGHLVALLAQRHMYKYGTRREAFAEIAISSRTNALNRPTALMRQPLTKDQYFNARMIAEPLCLYDFCLETDGAVAIITAASADARDLRQKPIYVLSCVHGGALDWGRGFLGMQMPDSTFTTAGNQPIAERLYALAGVGPKDVDVALLYDHFTYMVLAQLEDYGFCAAGEGGPFVESGAIRFQGGSIPVNPHGGQLSEAYVVGMTQIREAVEQLRGTAVNQVADAEIALVTGGPAPLPLSGLILSR
jgi:acetyl-CoA acetyltransferase